MHIIKVAGTNGKGSVCAMLEACLNGSGQRVGMFTSPHLTRITERFRVAGHEVALDTLDGIAQEVLRSAQRLVAQQGDSHVPSFFEALIVMALLLFHEQRVTIAIMEAGVGGYSDATSLLAGEVAVITSLGLDHQQQLGDSLAAIAADKAGIAKNVSRLILGPDISPELRAIIEKDVHVRELAVCQAQVDSRRVRLGDLRQPTRIEVEADGKTLSIALPLLGRHQVSNFATVTATLRALAEMAIIGGIECLERVRQTCWAGRLEVCDTVPRLLLDAAHNDQGLRALVDSLDDLLPYGERVLLYGASLGKDYEACLPQLSRLAPEIYLVEGFYRAQPARSIAARLPAHCGYKKSFPSPRQAIEYFSHCPDLGKRTLIATGSIFMIGELKFDLATTAESTNLSQRLETQDGSC
ncbi:MAG: dihydrofolate synthase / folylpolyglutamate synthase [Blastocatellia bacterium]